MSEIEAGPARGGKGEVRRLVILGATGSIGRSTAEVLALHPTRYTVAAVAGGRDGEALGRMAIRLGARFAAIADPDAYAALKDVLGGERHRGGGGAGRGGGGGFTRERTS